MEAANFVEEARNGIIAIHREVKQFYHKLEYGNLRGWCAFTYPTADSIFSAMKSYTVTENVDIPDFEERVNEHLQKGRPKHLIEEVDMTLVFEQSGLTSSGIRTAWSPNGNIMFHSYKEFPCRNSDEARAHVCDYIKELPKTRREILEARIREYVFRKGMYKTAMEYLNATCRNSPAKVYSAEEIAFALDLEKD